MKSPPATAVHVVQAPRTALLSPRLPGTALPPLQFGFLSATEAPGLPQSKPPAQILGGSSRGGTLRP